MKVSKEAAFSQTHTEVITWRKPSFVKEVLMTCHWLLHCIICCLLSFSINIGYFITHCCCLPTKASPHACTAACCCWVNLCTLPSFAVSQLVSVPRYGSTKILIHQSAMHGRYCHSLHCTRRWVLCADSKSRWIHAQITDAPAGRDKWLTSHSISCWWLQSTLPLFQGYWLLALWTSLLAEPLRVMPTCPPLSWSLLACSDKPGTRSCEWSLGKASLCMCYKVQE